MSVLRRAFVFSGLSALLAAGVLPAGGQVGAVPSGRAFRSSIGGSYLLPVGSMQAPADGRLPSARATFERQVGPGFGWGLGYLRVSVDDPITGDAFNQHAVNAGVLTLRYNGTRGRFRMAPFVEAGGGMAQSAIDRGGYTTTDGYVPVWSAVESTAFGGGAGLTLESILGPGFTLSLTGGYWHFQSLDEAVGTLATPMLGLGLRWTMHDERWYWRTSGADREPPELAVVEPAAGEDGVIRVAQPSVQLRIAAADRSGIDRVTVNGERVPLQAAAPGADDAVERREGITTVALASGENRVSLSAWDGADNRRDFEVVVQGPEPPAQPAAQQPPPAIAAAGQPVIDILEPAEWAGRDSRGLTAVARQSIRVRGTVRHAASIEEITINGARASVQFGNEGRSASFVGFVPVQEGLRDVHVEARAVDGAIGFRRFELDPRPVTENPYVHATRPLAEFDGRRFAVVIGISEYADPAIRDLRFADDDARAMHDFFRSPEAGLGGIPEENVLLLVDSAATMVAMRSALFTFLRRATEDDVVVVYIAAHGLPEPGRPENMYLIAHDTRLDDLPATGIPMGDVVRAIQDARGRMKIVFADACHSAGVGALAMRGVDSNAVNRVFLDMMNASRGGVVSFTSAEANQLSQEGEEFGGGHGVYTHFLLQGLRGYADEDGDHVVTLHEVMEYTRDQVQRETDNAQIPAISSTSFDRYWPMAVTYQEGGR